MTGATRDLRSLYGVAVATDFQFDNALPAGSFPPDLEFTCTSKAPPVAQLFTEAEPLIGLGRLHDGQRFMSVSTRGACDLIRYTEVADFYLEASHITCHLLDPEYRFVVEIYLLGFVMSYWLERFRGIPALHAAAVVVDHRAIGFLSTNKGGKTSLAASLMQAGYPLLTDDILTVEHRDDAFYGRPGYPQMRMWPDQAEHFMGSYRELDLVHPQLTKRRIPVGSDGLGSFCGSTTQLTRLYVPERREHGDSDAITITPLPPSEGVMTLIRLSFLVRVLRAVGLEAARLAFFSRLVQRVSMRTLSYPSGVEHLPAVREAVLADVRA